MPPGIVAEVLDADECGLGAAAIANDRCGS